MWHIRLMATYLKAAGRRSWSGFWQFGFGSPPSAFLLSIIPVTSGVVFAYIQSIDRAVALLQGVGVACVAYLLIFLVWMLVGSVFVIPHKIYNEQARLLDEYSRKLNPPRYGHIRRGMQRLYLRYNEHILSDRNPIYAHESAVDLERLGLSMSDIRDLIRDGLLDYAEAYESGCGLAFRRMPKHAHDTVYWLTEMGAKWCEDTFGFSTE